MSTESDQTEEQAIDFAQRLENMLTEVLGQPSDGQYTADPQGARKKRSASYLIKTRDPQGISLTVGGSTIGMVKTESSRPFTRLVVPMVFHAANRPSANAITKARPLVLMDTQNGR